MDQAPVIQCCSINGKICRNGKREDFPVDERTGERFFCNRWVNVKGKNPQTDATIDNWMCADFAQILLGLEQAQQTRQAGASTDKVVNTIFGLASPEAKERLLRAAPTRIEKKGA